MTFPQPDRRFFLVTLPCLTGADCIDRGRLLHQAGTPECKKKNHNNDQNRSKHRKSKMIVRSKHNVVAD